MDRLLAGEIPFDRIADNTRWMRKPQTFSSMEQAVRRTAEGYRRSLWDTQPVYVEVWCEKDALAGVFMEETAPWDVPLMVVKGYSSITYLYEAARYIASHGKPTWIYYFGDRDPWGVDITRNTEARLREFAPEAEIHFQHVAVNPEQIAAWKLPTRPTKRTGTLAKGFEGESVEVDAIPSRQLRALARQSIEQHIDQGALQVMKIAEREERAYLGRLAELQMGEVAL